MFHQFGRGTIVPVKLTVAGIENLEVPAGKYECHKIELNLIGGKQIFWYSTDAHRYLVKFEAGGIAAELTGVQLRKSGDIVSYSDPAYHFSLTAPAGWALYHSDTKER